MAKSNSKKYSIILCVILAIIAAMVLRQMDADVTLNRVFDILRASIYIGLFVAWGISIHRRIVQPQVSLYLIAISALMVLWIILRTIRYSLTDCIWLMRYLWYLYYLPMLLIPLLGVFVALSLGKTENFRLPKWTALFYIPTIVLFLLVMTNDLHQHVFIFPADAIVWMNDYRRVSGKLQNVFHPDGIFVVGFVHVRRHARHGADLTVFNAAENDVCIACVDGKDHLIFPFFRCGSAAGSRG